MKSRSRIAAVMTVLMVAGCGGRSGSVDVAATPETQPPTTSPASTTADTTTTVAPTTTAVEPTVTTTDGVTPSTLPAETAATSTTAPEAQSGSGEVPTIEELQAVVSVFVNERDAQIESSIAIDGDSEVLAGMEVERGLQESMTITYFGDTVVWDHSAGLREVSVDGQLLYLSEDGAWAESEEFEWPLYGALGEWSFAQSIAGSCLEWGPEVVGEAEVVGIPTLHIRCEAEGSSVDGWLDQNGLVMRLLFVQAFDDPMFTMETSWEVIGVDVAPTGPLPPGI